jgi:hypothetical protein
VSRRVILAVCVLSVALLSSCTQGATGSAPTVGHPTSSKPTTKPAPTHDPASDANLLTLLLGPTTPRCPEGTTRTEVTCGSLLATSAALVGGVAAALTDMPKTPAYDSVTQAASSFQTTYNTITTLGCYTPQPSSQATDKFCQQLADLASVSWLGMESAINQLATAH